MVLALRKSDRYPLLPKFDSNTPLEHLKHLLRVYVGHVRSECSPLFSNPVILQKSNPEFQNIFGRRIPWTSIRASNDAHVVQKSQHNQYTLEDPSRMTQKAVLGILSHWYKRQEAGKQWPLKFLKPERHILEVFDMGETENLNEGAGSEGEATEADGDDDEWRARSHGHPAVEVDGRPNRGEARGEKKQEESDTLPAILSQVDISLRKLFLKSLSKEGGYQKLVELLDTADVSVVHLIGKRPILTNPLAGKYSGGSWSPST